jgi:predicted nucleotidyltransferase
VSTPTDAVLHRLVSGFSARSQVVAMGLGGSRAAGQEDDHSDFDVYIYTKADTPHLTRLLDRLGDLLAE